VKDYSTIKNRKKTKQIRKRTSFPLQWKVWKTSSFHDLPQNADSLNWLEKQKPPTRKKWTPSLHTMTNSFTYLHDGSMPVGNKTFHAFVVHLASNAEKMPSHRLSNNSNRKNTQCLALPALCHEAWPRAHILTFTGEFCQKREFKNWKIENVVNLENFNC